MAIFERSFTVAQVQAMRRDLNSMVELQALLREAVRERMATKQMNHASLARATELKSPRRVQDFLEGSYVISAGKALASMAEFCDFPGEYTQKIETITSQYGPTACSLPLYGSKAVDFVCDVFLVFYRDSKELNTEDFAGLFDGAADFVAGLLNKRFEVLEPFLDPQNNLFSGAENNEVTRHVRSLIDKPDELGRRMTARVEDNNRRYAEMLDRWNRFQAEYGPTQREAAERLGIPKSTVSNAVTLTNAHRIKSLGAVLQKVDAFFAEQAEGRDGKRRGKARPGASDESEEQPDSQGEEAAPTEDEPSDMDEPSSPAPLPVSGRLTREAIRSLRVDDHKALVGVAAEQAHRLVQTLGYLLRMDDEESFEQARAKLGRVLAELHSSIYLLTSHVGLEELIDMVEGDQRLGRSLSD